MSEPSQRLQQIVAQHMARAERTRRSRRWRRRLALAGLGMVALLAAGLVVLVMLARTPPAAWTQARARIERMTPQERSRLAEQAARKTEQALGLAEFKTQMLAARAPRDAGSRTPEKVRGGTDMSQGEDAPPSRVGLIRMSVDEINAWLTTELDAWLGYKGYQMPAEIRKPTFALQAGKMMVGFEAEARGVSQVFTSEVGLSIDDDGRAEFRLEGVRAGRLSLPGAVTGAAASAVSGQSDKVAQWLSKLEGKSFEPMFPVDPMVKARVLDYQVENDGVTFLVRLEPRGARLAPLTRQQVAEARRTLDFGGETAVASVPVP